MKAENAKTHHVKFAKVEDLLTLNEIAVSTTRPQKRIKN